MSIHFSSLRPAQVPSSSSFGPPLLLNLSILFPLHCKTNLMSIINLSALICLSFSGLWLVSVFIEFSVIVCSHTKKNSTQCWKISREISHATIQIFKILILYSKKEVFFIFSNTVKTSFMLTNEKLLKNSSSGSCNDAYWAFFPRANL